MKKIYIILTAVFALLTLSLNAHSAPNRADRAYILLNDDIDGSKFSTGSAINPSAPWTATSVQNQTGGVLYIGSNGSLKFTVPSGYSNTDFKFVFKTSTSYYNGSFTFTPSTSTAKTVSTSAASTEYNCEITGLSAGNTVTITGRYGSYSYSPDFLYMYVYVNSTEPVIVADPNSLTLTTQPGTPVSQTVTVTGGNLTDNISVSLSDANGVFSIDNNSLGSNGGNLTVTYSPTAVGTHTATITLTSGSITETITLNGSCVQEKTICDGTGTNQYLPIYGYYYDDLQINQMIYPESLLTDLVGKEITSMTFYSPHLYFYGGKYKVQMGTTSQTSFSSAARNTADLTATVATNLAATAGGTELTITFDNPFPYNGGNLLVDFQVTETGSYGGSGNYTYFYGATQSGGGFHSYGSSTNSNGVYTSNGVDNFLPKVTFAYIASGPSIEITPETQTINDAAAGTLTITGTNVEGNINVSAANTTDWNVNPTSFSSTGGTANVSYTGRALSASNTVTAEAANDNTVTDEATVNYVADLYIVTDNGVQGNWDFTDGTQMTNNDGVYTATFTATNPNTFILFARKLGNDVDWNTRYVFGPDSGGDWVWGANTGGDIDVNDDDPIKLPDAGIYTVTINANDGAFTITKLVPTLTAPTSGTTVNVGTNEGSGASTTVTVSGNYLTEDLAVSVSGDGFSVSPTSISAADANNGTTITVTYNGTDPNATGTLTIGSNEVSVTVDLTASYVAPVPELTAPIDDSTLDLGTNYGRGVSKTVTISGNNLTQDLTVSVSGAGFSASRDVTVTAAEANAGKDITVTYNGTNANATGELTISSNEVSATVHLTASYATSGSITVCDGEYNAEVLPVCGYFYDEAEHNQMVYPASELADMEGMHITSMTFYPCTGWHDEDNDNVQDDGEIYSGINFYGGSVTFKLMNLSSGTSAFADENPTLITGTMTPVSTVVPEKNTSATTWVITFDEPFEYTGGDLLIDVTTTAGDTWSPSFFIVDAVDSNLGAYNCSYNGTNYRAGVDFLPKVTFTFNNGETPVTPVEGGLLRLHLLFCDQLKASIPEDNSHPDAYGYILKFEPEGGETKESGEVRVNIQKTDCEVMGYYTLDQIDRDTDRGLTMDVLTADVEYDLTNTNDLLNYYYLQGKVNGYPTLDGDYLSKLYRQEDFTYREMYEGSYEFDHVFNSGEHHYFNSAIDPIIGSYGDATKFVSYAPSVTTWGIQRRYFELDGKDNTYGAPVWKTAVGKVEMSSQVKPVVERQTNNDNSVNWGSGEEAASLYMLNNVEAIGYLPPTNLTKVEFEPYMFRIFVESKNGLLRPYKVVEANPANTDQPGEHLEAADGELTEADMKGPICVWSGYIKYDNDGLPTQDPENGVELSYSNINGPFTFHKDKVDRDAGYTPNGNPLGEWDKDSNNAMFGALDALAISGYDAQGKPILNTNITEDDLKIFVRFYYSVKGELADHTVWSRAEGSRSGNGAESGAKAPDPATGVNEIVYHGEIVETIYYNVQGMMSDKPFEGVNIIVNRYSDGTSSVSKVVK